MKQRKLQRDTRGSQKFFGIVGLLAIGFGVCVAFFDMMFDPTRSAILGVVYILLGSLCLMCAVAMFLRHLDQIIAKQDGHELDGTSQAGASAKKQVAEVEFGA